MKEAMKFAVFPDVAEYHATREVPFAYHDSACGEVKGVALNSLCGAYIGSPAELGGADRQQEEGEHARTRLFDLPPAGFAFCDTCARLMAKPKGWRRVLSHYFRYRGGFRLASR